MDNPTKKSWFSKKLFYILLILFIIVVTVLLLRPASQQTGAAQAQSAQKWTCSMHPEIIRDKPGNCPKCGMTLVPLEVHTDVNVPANAFVASDAILKLMEVETAVVERRAVENHVRFFGRLDYDESLKKTISAWVAGRIDRLFVDFTGITVKKGDHLVDLYSPQLISAQAELLQAVKGAASLGTDSSELIKTSSANVLEAARQKLRLLGITDEQIKTIESGGQALTHITITAPIGGIVIEKNAYEGMYVDTGTPIYKVADLSKLWLMLYAYELDLVWIRYGQTVEFTVEAYPGEIFRGTISFIDPVLDEKTRTVMVRVNVDNSQGKLKPAMFVNALVHSKMATSGKVIAPELADKWICPMHPDVISSNAGDCTICGMPLVTAKSLGFVRAEVNEMPLVIPATAPLITGKRAIVYVQDPNLKKPMFEGVEIVLGPRAGDFYIVESGLAEGQRVVTRGNFKIDAALQLQAKKSMMNPEASSTAAPVQIHQH